MSYLLLYVYLFCFLFSSFESLQLAIPRLRLPYVSHASADSTNNDVLDKPWWGQDSTNLLFKCTGCGRCCLNEGEVWMDSGEFTDIADFMNISLLDLMNEYTEISGGWARAKNYISPTTNEEKCIFLAEDNKQCTIYPVRPNQCRTYPWWPRLLLSESNWMEEACAPDDAEVGRKWSAGTGGCEGINHVNATTVDSLTISRNLDLSSLYNKFGPLPSIMTHDEERSRFLERTKIVKAITASTKAWVKDFIVKYNLCPFAERALLNDAVRYKVFLGSDVEQIIELVKFEMLHLMTTTNEEVSTTLIMLPFAFQEFEEFYEFSIKLEDEILPKLERQSRPAYTMKTMETRNIKNDSRKQSTIDKTSNSQNGQDFKVFVAPGADDNDEESREVQVVTFHPAFQFADTALNDPLNFEKRAPFPTLNLLRAAKIRQLASEGKTAQIAVDNEKSLLTAGGEQLLIELQRIINIALE